MSKEYFFKTENLLIWRPAGALKIDNIQEFIEFLEEQLKVRDQNFARFIDLSRVETISVNHDELYGIATERRDYAETEVVETIKMAFYVTNSLSFGMARMYENLLDSRAYDIGIFYSLQQIADFLNVNIALLSED